MVELHKMGQELGPEYENTSEGEDSHFHIHQSSFTTFVSWELGLVYISNPRHPSSHSYNRPHSPPIKCLLIDNIIQNQLRSI